MQFCKLRHIVQEFYFSLWFPAMPFDEVESFVEFLVWVKTKYSRVKIVYKDVFSHLHPKYLAHIAW